MVKKQETLKSSLSKQEKANFSKLHDFRADLQSKISSSQFCWVCGRENLLTSHHAIPQRVKNPILNLLIPVCENCVHAVHNGDEITAILKRIYLR